MLLDHKVDTVSRIGHLNKQGNKEDLNFKEVVHNK
jgi:hypothetical protein